MRGRISKYTQEQINKVVSAMETLGAVNASRALAEQGIIITPQLCNYYNNKELKKRAKQ